MVVNTSMPGTVHWEAGKGRMHIQVVGGMIKYQYSRVIGQLWRAVKCGEEKEKGFAAFGRIG
jgi:hypothetical protein